jgi:hypothetical protein
MHDLLEICDEMIEDGFPELLGDPIWITFQSSDDSLAGNGVMVDDGLYIDIDSVFQRADPDVVRGAIAGELGQIVAGRKKRLDSNWASHLVNLVGLKVSKRLRELERKNSDLEVVMRGYGRQLLALIKYVEDETEFRYDSENGLSRREVEALLDAK